MPYIKPSLRVKVSRDQSPRDSAELNYLICKLIDVYCENVGFKYQTVADVRGAVVGALEEFEQRFVGPYEQMKLREAGEVFIFMAERIKEVKPTGDVQ